MKRVELSGERPLTAPGSVQSAVRRISGEAHVVVIQVEPGGVVGRHRTGAVQLFVVCKGSGWASGADGQRVPLEAGDAVVWEAGEEHESGSDSGMTVLVVEGEFLDI